MKGGYTQIVDIPHRKSRQLISQFANGFLTAEEIQLLKVHLGRCEECRAYASRLMHLEEGDQGGTLETLLGTRSPEFSSESSLAQDSGRIAPAGRGMGTLKELAWVALGLLGVILAGWIFTRQTAGEGSPIFPSPTPPLPTPLSPGAQIASEPSPRVQTLPRSTSTGPVISSDGLSLVFESSNPNLVAGDTNSAFDIFVYSRQGGVLERVSLTNGGEQADGDSSNPDISEDGRFIVFASTAQNLSATFGGACEGTKGKTPCSRIYLHDRQQHSTELVSVWSDGFAIERNAFQPVISGDGRWVAFWVYTGGMPDGGCQHFEPQSGCSDLFLHDRTNGTTHFVKIGKNPANTNSFQLDISRDGRYLTLLISRWDAIANRLRVINRTEIYVFDQQAEVFNAININAKNEPGDRPAFLSSISADGHFVAFASQATNLVPGDTNGQIDVFVRDLLEGSIARVSVGSGGQQGDGHSGVLGSPGPDDLIGLSADGRYVTFISSAGNLMEDTTSVWCGPADQGRWTCFSLFIHDRVSGETRQIRPFPLGVFPIASRLLAHPTISENGRWLAFMGLIWEAIEDCPSGGCSDVYLHDQKIGETVLVSNENRTAPERTQEWIYWKSLVEHEGRVNDIAFDQAGGFMVTGGDDGFLQVWRTSDWELVHTLFAHEQPVTSVAIPLSGDLLAAGSFDGRVSIWNLTEGRRTANLDVHSGQVLGLAFSPAGKILAVSTKNIVSIWERVDDNFSLVEEYHYPGGLVGPLAFSPDGIWLAAADRDGSVWLRNLRTGAVDLRLAGHKEKVLDLAFSPDGRFLATASEDSTVILWQIETNSRSLEATYWRTLQHNDWVKSLAFSPDSRFLAAGSFDSSINLWAIPKGVHAQTLRRTTQDQPLAMAFSKDGKTLAASTVRGTVRLWSLSEGAAGALQKTQFYSRADEDQYFDSRPNLFYLPGISRIRPEYTLSEDKAQSLLSFELKTPNPLPKDLTLEGIRVYHEAENDFQAAVLVYIRASSFQPSILTLIQSNSNLAGFDQPIGRSAQIFPLQVNGNPAEYVQGGWSFADNFLDGAGNVTAIQFFWDHESASHWLRWQDGSVFYGIRYENPYNIEFMLDIEVYRQQDLLAFAESLEGSP